MGEYQAKIQSLLSGWLPCPSYEAVQAVGIVGHFGHWSPGMPIAHALDHCVEVRLYKGRGQHLQIML